ncbi:MAG: hypothetical protein GY762_17520 [Proteobacteria bacterium]|nr:hypothetical protein [Pseudomonadota bacterium]
MYRFSMTRMQSCQLLALAVAVALSSGCCISPYNNHCTSSSTRPFYGFTLKPGETIRVQAQGGRNRGEGEWNTIAVTRTGSMPIPGFNGIHYYFWAAGGLSGVEIPEYCWHGLGDGSVTNVRCIDSTGRVLYSMENDIGSLGVTLEDNPLDVWLEHGNRDHYMTLFRH